MHGSFIGRVKKLFLSVRKSVGRLLKGRAAVTLKAAVGPYVNRIVSDAILFNEIPSPTEREALRADFILQRLSECGYPNSSIDDYGNVTAIVPAFDHTDEHTLLFADIRNEAYSPIDSMTRLEGGRVCGKGIAENSVGVATLLVLAEYLANNAIQYDRNITLLFTSFDPGAQEVQPLEKFLRDWKEKLRLAVHVRGLELGRVEEQPMGTYKLSVTARTPEQEVMGGKPAPSAISVLANVAFRLDSIRWDSENNTFLNVARLEAGVGFGWYASEGILELEIFSPDRNSLEMAKNAVCATIKSISVETGAAVEIAVKTFLPAGNAEINSGLNAILRSVVGRLRLKSRPVSIPGYTAFINSFDIPAVCIGITTGRKSFKEEYIDIRPIETGFRLLLTFLEECTGRSEGGVR
ncbi:MAG: hypothetical protein AB1798_00735 [Spirochaetota bacterium]